MGEPDFEKILKAKTDYYGKTEAAYEFAAEEYARQLVKSTLWISVKDRLPEADGRVLAWAKGWFACKIFHFIVEAHPEKEAFVYFWYEENTIYEPENEPLIKEDGDIMPTHWMPLPDPPKT